MFDDDYTDKAPQLITIEELNKIIAKCNNKTSTDVFGISSIILKNIPNSFRLILTNYFNNCLIENQIPLPWKKSTINMIPKKGDTHNIKNYRPISSTATLMKLFEKIIAERLKKFLECNQLIIKQQSGFRNNRLTKDNLYLMSQKIMEAFSRKEKVCCIFFDI